MWVGYEIEIFILTILSHARLINNHNHNRCLRVGKGFFKREKGLVPQCCLNHACLFSIIYRLIFNSFVNKSLRERSFIIICGQKIISLPMTVPISLTYTVFLRILRTLFLALSLLDIFFFPLSVFRSVHFRMYRTGVCPSHWNFSCLFVRGSVGYQKIFYTSFFYVQEKSLACYRSFVTDSYSVITVDR